MHLSTFFRFFTSILLTLGIAVLSVVLVVAFTARTVATPKTLEKVITDYRVADTVISNVVDAYVTPETLAKNDVRFLTVAQTKTALHSLFPSDWVQAHLLLFIQQGYRLLEPNAHVGESVFILSLETPKQRIPETLLLLQPSIAESPFGTLVAEMTPGAVVDLLPDQLNILRFMIPGAATTTPTSFDPLGLRIHRDPLTQEEVDQLEVVSQENITLAQTIIARVRISFPALIVLFSLAFGALVLVNIHHSITAWKWAGVAFLFSALPWVSAVIVLLMIVPAQFMSVLVDIPEPLRAQVYTLGVGYLQIISTHLAWVGAGLLYAAIFCICWSWHLHILKKRSTIS